MFYGLVAKLVVTTVGGIKLASIPYYPDINYGSICSPCGVPRTSFILMTEFVSVSLDKLFIYLTTSSPSYVLIPVLSDSSLCLLGAISSSGLCKDY